MLRRLDSNRKLIVDTLGHLVDQGDVTGAAPVLQNGGKVLRPSDASCIPDLSADKKQGASAASGEGRKGRFNYYTPWGDLCLMHVNAAYHGAALKITILRLISPVVDQRYVEIIVKFNREDERWRKRCNGRRRRRGRD